MMLLSRRNLDFKTYSSVVLLLLMLCFSSILQNVSGSNYKIKWKKLESLSTPSEPIPMLDMVIDQAKQEIIITGYDNNDPLNHHFFIYDIIQRSWSYTTETRITNDIRFLSPQLYRVEYDQSRKKLYNAYGADFYEVVRSNDNQFFYNYEPFTQIYDLDTWNYDLYFIYNNIEDHLFVLMKSRYPDYSSETRIYNLQTSEWILLNNTNSEVFEEISRGELVFNSLSNEITYFQNTYERDPFNFSMSFDYSTMMWERQESINYPSWIYSMALTYDGKIDRYVGVAGRLQDRSGYTNDIWIYNHHTKAWQEDNSLPDDMKRVFVGVVYNPVDSLIYAFGGWDGVGSYRDLYSIDIQGTGFEEKLDIRIGTKIAGMGLLLVSGLVVVAFYYKNKKDRNRYNHSR